MIISLISVLSDLKNNFWAIPCGCPFEFNPVTQSLDVRVHGFFCLSKDDEFGKK